MIEKFIQPGLIEHLTRNSKRNKMTPRMGDGVGVVV